MCNSRRTQIAEAYKGLKPLVVKVGLLRFTRNDDTKELKNFNNNAAFPKGRLWRAHCVLFSELLTQWASRTGRRAKATLLSKFFTFDNLSRSNSCLVINNFKLIQRRIFYESI